MTQVGDRLEHAIEERADVEHEIERGEAEQPARKKLVRTVFWLAVTGISLYLVAPSLLDTLGSWEDLDRLSPAWLGLMLVLQAGVARVRVGAPVPRHARAFVAGGDQLAARRQRARQGRAGRRRDRGARCSTGCWSRPGCPGRGRWPG